MFKKITVLICSLLLISSFAITSYAATLKDELSSLTPPSGIVYNNLTQGTKDFSNATKWPSVPDKTVLDLKDGVSAGGTAVYEVKDATKVTVGFFANGGTVASQMSWGYSRGWEYLPTASWEDPSGKKWNPGDHRTVDMNLVTKIYRDPTVDKLYTKQSNGKWYWFIGNPNFGFSECAAPTNTLYNYGMTIEYSKNGTDWTFADYDISEIRGEDDYSPPDGFGADGGDGNHWYYEKCNTNLPTGTNYVRVTIDDVKKWYEGTAGNPTLVNANRNWSMMLGSVEIEYSGQPLNSKSSASQASSNPSSSVSSETGSKIFEVSDVSSGSNMSASSSESTSSKTESSKPKTNNSGTALIIGLIIVVLAAGAGLLYFFVLKKKLNK